MKKPVLLAIALLSTLELAGCSVLPQRGSHEERQKELDAATKDLNIPSVEKTLYDSGVEALDSGNSLKAEYYFDQLIKKDPKNDIYKLKYADSLRRRGANKEALGYYDDVLKNRPNDLDVVESRALCLLAMGEFEKAGPILTDIIQKDPTRWKSINAAGLIFAINKKFKEANQYFDLAANVSDNNPTVLNNQGLVRALLGNFDDAVKILKTASTKANEQSSQKRQIDLNLAMVYGITKDMDKAESTASPYLTRPQLYNNMGIYAELAKDPDLARTYLNKALMGTSIYYDRAWDNLERLGTPAAATPGTTPSVKKVKK